MSVLLISCNTGGHLGVSVSVSESIERKTYISSYNISNTCDSICKNLSSTILEIFSEEPWYVGRDDNTIKPDFVNIIIRTNNESFFDDYGLEGFTQTDKNLQIYRHNRDLQNDTLLIPVYRASRTNEIIDTIVFIRK